MLSFCSSLSELTHTPQHLDDGKITDNTLKRNLLNERFKLEENYLASLFHMTYDPIIGDNGLWFGWLLHDE